MNKPGIAAVAFSLVFLGALSPAGAQFYPQYSMSPPAENIEGFTVAGKAYSAAKPNAIEIDLDVSASSELTADAIVKYRDAKKRIHDAFGALKLKNVEIEERGLLVDQKGMMQNPYMWGGMPNTRTKTEVQLSRKLVVKANDIRSMPEDAVLQLVGKLLDVAQDSGGKVGEQNDFNPYYGWRFQQRAPGLVRFVLEDFDKLQEEAYEKAIADARARAERLARLSKVELGRIVAVREIVVPGDRMVTSEDETPRKRLEVSRFQEIPIRVELFVRFEIHSKSDKK
jgi:uncharacterized protein